MKNYLMFFALPGIGLVVAFTVLAIIWTVFRGLCGHDSMKDDQPERNQHA